jgi:hypothetical protein
MHRKLLATGDCSYNRLLLPLVTASIVVADCA